MERVVRIEVVVTSGGGRVGWVRNSGYVTMGGRSEGEESIVSAVRNVSEEEEECVDGEVEVSVVSGDDWRE